MTPLTKIFSELFKSLNYLSYGKIKFKALNFIWGFTFYQKFSFPDTIIIIPQSVFYHSFPNR